MHCDHNSFKGFAIDRRDFSHWGVIPDWRNDVAFATWTAGNGARAT